MAPQIRDFVQRLLEQQGIDLGQWLQDQRSQGLSYNRIASELHRLSGGVVTVTGQTVGLWLSELAEAPSQGVA